MNEMQKRLVRKYQEMQPTGDSPVLIGVAQKESLPGSTSEDVKFIHFDLSLIHI